jgi:hypothetical protein
LLQRPLDLGAGGKAWIELGFGFGVHWAGVNGFGGDEFGAGEAG